MTDRIIKAILRPIVLLTHPCKLVGREKIPADGKVILCSNHLSNWDPVLLLLSQPRRIAFMAKEELFRFKPLGWLIGRIFGAFPVARGKGDTGALDAGARAIESGDMMGIFPEGTRSKDGRLMRFKSGAALIAARTGASVLPVGIDRRAKAFRRVTVTIGDLITPEELHLAGDTPDLRYATRLMRERVQALSGQEAM
ncbi:MAG: 1-acyl-sn-glycerol-3-phosphate acyltransferase [Ruminococcaceae bacterium]|nr:1-acyl-sn-glycerol-3-phosphate acyltransferase [Oscillospiraceae bacterium]